MIDEKENHFDLIEEFINNEIRNYGMKMHKIYEKENKIKIKTNLILDNLKYCPYKVIKLNEYKIIYRLYSDDNFYIFNLKNKQIETLIKHCPDLEIIFYAKNESFKDKFYAENINSINLKKINILKKLGFKKSIKRQLINYNINVNKYNKDKEDKRDEEYNFDIYSLDNNLEIKKIKINFIIKLICSDFEIDYNYSYLDNDFFYFLFHIKKFKDKKLYYIGKININDTEKDLEYYYYSYTIENLLEIKYIKNKIYIIEKTQYFFDRELIEINCSEFLSNSECYYNYYLP